NTGRWRDREGLSNHLRPGIAKVVLTAQESGAPQQPLPTSLPPRGGRRGAPQPPGNLAVRGASS
ncbi:hypothetical protein AB0B51_16225, partial [Streptomyces griseus]|uniref:hypothetical protein n=1 Tax=Streptomyces griseus TaxID=1911 RepID=UPI0033DAF550